jgi:peroxiredoxin
MKKLGIWSAIVIAAALAAPARAARVGDPAPSFTATDSNGARRSLAEFAGKYVVLEWHNNGCPFVRKHYESGNMQADQKEWTARGVVWLTVISSAPGKQGFVTADEENAYLKRMNAAPTAALLDPAGQLGHLFDAKTSPHMFIVDPAGKLIYNGAIDDQPTPDPASLTGATNYVSQALTQAMAGKPVTLPTSRPYGCSVKYAD